MAHFTTRDTHTARKHHGSRAKCNYDEHSQRTSIRTKINNSREARARYVQAEAE